MPKLVRIMTAASIVVAASLLAATPSSATTIILDKEFDAGTVGNHASVTVTQAAGALDFIISLAGTDLGAGSDIHEFYFNLVGSPTGVAMREHDLSFTLGGPVLKDMAWVLANVHYTSLGRTAPFNYWTDPTGVRHFVYDYSERSLSAMFKLSMDVLDKFKGVIEIGMGGLREPVYEPDVDQLRPESATRNLDGDRAMLARLAGSYVIGQAMRLDLSVGYAKDRKHLLVNDLAKSKPEYFDIVSGYSCGSAPLNDRETVSRMKVSAALSRIQDGFLGTFHERVAGGEYETTKSASSTFKADNLVYNYADGQDLTPFSRISAWPRVVGSSRPCSCNASLLPRVRR